MIIHDLQEKGLIQPPKFLADNTAYLTIMGSLAYGVSGDASDEDVYGFCLPPKESVFPHLAGDIIGFGTQKQRFEQWQQHGIKIPHGNKEYDFAVFSIVKYFALCMENNPNMIDSLFTPQRCIKHATEVGRMVRDRRKMFLHKGAWHKFKGYAYSQVNKMEIKRQNDPEVVEFRKLCEDNGYNTTEALERGELLISQARTSLSPFDNKLADLVADIKAKGKRYVDIARHGFDVKFAYHVVRLLGEVEQIMIEGDLDLERNREQLKAIRRGEWSQQQIIQYFEGKEKDLEKVYLDSKLQHSPDEVAIKALLMDCLEHHYGSISNMVTRDNSVDALVKDMQAVIQKYAGR